VFEFIDRTTFLNFVFSQEYEVSAHTYKDVGGCEKAQNIWEFVTSKKIPGSEDDDGTNDDTKTNK